MLWLSLWFIWKLHEIGLWGSSIMYASMDGVWLNKGPNQVIRDIFHSLFFCPMNKIYICCNDPLGKPGAGEAIWLEWLSCRTHSFHASNQKLKCRPLKVFHALCIFLVCQRSTMRLHISSRICSPFPFLLSFLHDRIISRGRNYVTWTVDSGISLFNLISIRYSLFLDRDPYYLH